MQFCCGTSRLRFVPAVLSVVSLLVCGMHAAEPAEEADDVGFDIMLRAMEQAFRDVPPKDRHQAPRYVLAAAAYALAADGPAPADKWRPRLVGNMTPASEAYDIFKDLLQGKLDRLFDLRLHLPDADWYALTHWMNERSKWLPTLQHTRDAAVAMSLLNTCSRQAQSYHASRSLQVVTDAPENIQIELRQLILAAAKSGKHDEGLSRLRATLRGAVRYGRLKQAEWFETSTDITTDAGEHADLLDALADLKMFEPAAAMAIRAASAHPADPDVAIAAFDTLLRAGKSKDAFTIALNAEQAVPYPGRRRVRLHYLTWLYHDSRRSGAKKREGMMSFEEERQERLYAATHTGEVEAQMALGDIHAASRQGDDAVNAYRTAWEQSNDPVVKWTAWLAWAELNAGEAWHLRDAVENLARANRNAPVSYATFVVMGVATGLAAGNFEEALQWAEERLARLGKTPEAERLAPAVAALSWAVGREQETLALLNAKGDTAIREQTVRQVLALPRDFALEPEIVPPVLASAVSRELSSRLKASECRSSAVRLAAAQIPAYTSVQGVTSTWTMVVGTVSEKSDAGAAHQSLFKACCQWLDRHPNDTAAVAAVMEAAANHLARGRGSRSRQDALPLLTACLARAAHTGVPADQVGKAIRPSVARLEKRKSGAETRDAMLRAVGKHYPDLAREIKGGEEL